MLRSINRTVNQLAHYPGDMVGCAKTLGKGRSRQSSRRIPWWTAKTQILCCWRFGVIPVPRWAIALSDPAWLVQAVRKAGQPTQPDLKLRDPTSLVEVVNKVVRS